MLLKQLHVKCLVCMWWLSLTSEICYLVSLFLLFWALWTHVQLNPLYCPFYLDIMYVRLCTILQVMKTWLGSQKMRLYLSWIIPTSIKFCTMNSIDWEKFWKWHKTLKIALHSIFKPWYIFSEYATVYRKCLYAACCVCHIWFFLLILMIFIKPKGCCTSTVLYFSCRCCSWSHDANWCL